MTSRLSKQPFKKPARKKKSSAKSKLSTPWESIYKRSKKDDSDGYSSRRRPASVKASGTKSARPRLGAADFDRTSTPETRKSGMKIVPKGGSKGAAGRALGVTVKRKPAKGKR